MRSLLSLVVVGLVAGLVQAQAKPDSTALKPVQKNPERHEKFLEIAKKGNIDVLFLGDSITDAWGGEGHSPTAAGTKVLAKEFGSLKLANFGIGGDRTQHIIWRLQNGELDNIKPKVVMLMIGTNNSNGNDNTAEEIADGIKAIISEIHKKSPETKVLLLGIFPRHTAKAKDPNNAEDVKNAEAANKAQAEKLNKVNSIIAKLDDGGKKIKYLDIGDKFKKDGAIPLEIMRDQLHLTEAGYQIWADAVKGPINDLLGKK